MEWAYFLIAGNLGYRYWTYRFFNPRSFAEESPRDQVSHLKNQLLSRSTNNGILQTGALKKLITDESHSFLDLSHMAS